MSNIRREQLGSDADILSARLASANRSAPRSPTEALQPEPVPPPPLRSRAVRHPLVVFLNFVLTIVIIAVVVIGGGLFLGKMQFDKPSSLDQPRTIAIERGTGLTAIADHLQKNGSDRKQVAVHRRRLAERSAERPEGRRVPHPGPRQHA